jgi:hypothetical protein
MHETRSEDAVKALADLWQDLQARGGPAHWYSLQERVDMILSVRPTADRDPSTELLHQLRESIARRLRASSDAQAELLQ